MTASMHDWHEIRVKYGQLVWSTVYRILVDECDAMDCYQDVFLEAFERVGKNPVRNWPGLLRWLATRRAIDRLRRRHREQQQVIRADGIEELVESATEPSSSLEMQELKARLRSELATLPSQQAEAFWLRHIEELTYSEIGDLMDVDINTVGVLIHRARAKLRRRMADLQIRE